jgi:hypothetical protein
LFKAIKSNNYKIAELLLQKDGILAGVRNFSEETTICFLTSESSQRIVRALFQRLLDEKIKLSDQEYKHIISIVGKCNGIGSVKKWFNNILEYLSAERTFQPNKKTTSIESKTIAANQ